MAGFSNVHALLIAHRLLSADSLGIVARVVNVRGHLNLHDVSPS